MRVLVTGGAGFIGSAVCRHLVGERGDEVLNFDKLTYAGNPASLAEIAASPRYRFRQGDVADLPAIRAAFEDFAPEAVIHLAAETHVDRSIDSARPFVDANVLGVFGLLEAARDYLRRARRRWRRGSGCCTFPPTRCSARWAPRAPSTRPRPIARPRPTRPPRRRATTWRGPGRPPTGCR
jgi:nucleoside-diphosphate-sugar epimerase